MGTIRLGGCDVDPARNVIGHGGASWSLEPKVMDLLVLLAAHPGEVLSRETLIDQVWKVEFGADESLTRAVSLLRKTFREAGYTDEIIETIPKRGYRLVIAPEPGPAPTLPAPAPAASPPPATATATVEPRLVSPAPEPAPAGPAPKTGRGRFLPLAGIAAALVLVAVAAYLLRPQQGPAEAAPTSQLIAFFEFTPTGDDPAAKATAETATDRMFQAIRSNLLSAVARTETKNTPEDARLSRAAALGARYALSGEVRPDANGMTLAVRFEDVASRLTLWERSISSPAPDVAYLPAEAALQTSEVLWCIIKTRSEMTRDTIEILNLIADRCREGGGASSLTFAYMAARMRAVAEADPDSAFNQAQLVMMLGLGVATAPPATQAAWLAEADAALKRATDIDPEEPGVYLARITLAQGKRVSMAEWDAIIQEAVAKSEGKDNFVFGQSNNFRFLVLREAGRFREALPHEVAAVANDPLTSPWFAGLHRAVLGQKAEARAVLEPAVAAYGKSVWYPVIGYALFFDVVDTEATLASPPSTVPKPTVACMHDIHAALASNAPAARAAGAKRAHECGDAVGPMVELGALAALNDLDAAFEVAGAQAFDQPSTWSGAVQVLFWPVSRAMRTDPRFLPLVEKLGLMDYWRATKSQPDVCETETAPFCTALKG